MFRLHSGDKPQEIGRFAPEISARLEAENVTLRYVTLRYNSVLIIYFQILMTFYGFGQSNLKFYRDVIKRYETTAITYKVSLKGGVIILETLGKLSKLHKLVSEFRICIGTNSSKSSCPRAAPRHLHTNLRANISTQVYTISLTFYNTIIIILL